MRYYLFLLTVILGGVAQSACAAVTIHEVAWMGSASSPNHEWIELYNSGSAVEVDGWTLADGANLLITLTGTIPAQSYAVLERTSDDSAPGAAFLLYTGALVNTGTTLTLRRGDGQIEDQVAGGEGWQTIGGDNITKATAQYTSAGWITGVPTPGAANNTSGAPAAEEEDDEQETENENESPALSTGTGSESVSKKSRRSAATPVIPATTELALTVDTQSIAYVNQLVSFTAVPKGIGKTITESLAYEWNFGDMSTASGSEVVHAFTHPGTYLVTLRGHYARHDVVARHELTVLPVDLTVTRTGTGSFLLSNNAVYDIDVSGYRVMVGKRERVFPPHSLIMAKQSIVLPFAASNEVAAVFDTKKKYVAGTSLAVAEPAPVVLSAASVPAAVAPRVVLPGSRVAPAVAVTPEVAKVASSAELAVETLVASSPADTAEKPAEHVPSRWPYALFGILMVGVVGVLFLK